MRILTIILLFCSTLNAQFISTGAGGPSTQASEGGNGLVGTSIENTTVVDCNAEALWHSKFVSTSAGTISYGHLYINDGNNAEITREGI